MKKYFLDKDSYEKIEKSHLRERVEQAIRNYEIETIGAVYQGDVQENIKELKKNGYFENIPEAIEKQYKEILSALFSDPKDKQWVIHTLDDKKIIHCDPEDALIASGYFPSKILSPHEFWTVYREIGFENPIVFLEALSLYIREKKENLWTDNRIYNWEHKTPENRIMKTSFYKNTHLDSWILREDKTPYPTHDPFGNRVDMHPEVSSLQENLYLKQDCETFFLEVVLQYTEEISETQEKFKKRIQDVLSWIEEKTSEEERNRKHYFYGDTELSDMFQYFGDTLYKKGLPTNESSKMIQQHSFVIPRNSGEYYVRKNEFGHLLILNKDGQILATFYPEETDHLLKGIAQQSFTGLVRSPIKLIYNMLQYRISDVFEKEREKH